MPKRSRKAEHNAVVRRARRNYAAMLQAQLGKCGICNREQDPKWTRGFYVDHDHKTMEIRGLLCFRCNRALPSYVTAEWLRAAAKYLDDPPAQGVPVGENRAVD